MSGPAGAIREAEKHLELLLPQLAQGLSLSLPRQPPLALEAELGGLSIKSGSQQGFPLRRGFSFSPAAIFRGLGSTAGASVEPTCCPHRTQAGPSWGQAAGAGGGQAGSLTVLLGRPLSLLGQGCSACFRARG